MEQCNKYKNIRRKIIKLVNWIIKIEYSKYLNLIEIKKWWNYSELIKF